jgi:hypothetical protein
MPPAANTAVTRRRVPVMLTISSAVATTTNGGLLDLFTVRDRAITKAQRSACFNRRKGE